MLNEGLVIFRVEYVVVEILSSSDLWSIPPDSDGSSSCSLWDYLKLSTNTWRSYKGNVEHCEGLITICLIAILYVNLL